MVILVDSFCGGGIKARRTIPEKASSKVTVVRMSFSKTMVTGSDVKSSQVRFSLV